MNVLLTTISLDAARGGGTAQRTRHLALHMQRLGAQCRVLAMQGGSLGDDLRTAGIPVHATGSVRLKFQIPLLNMLALDRLVREADVIHVLGYWNLLSVAIAALAARRGKPYALSAAGEFAALRKPRPIARAFHQLFGQRMIRQASSLLAITPLEREEIIRELGVAADRVVVIPNGVDEPAGEIQADPRLPAKGFVLFLGRLAPIKGPDLLLDAFAAVASEFPDLDLVFAGPDFGMRAELEQRVHALGLAARVVFTGYLDDRARQAAYRAATMVAVPSRAEAMSLVALEAGAAAKPVLLTDQCGFDEIEAAGGGRVVPATVAGLRDGLRAMLCDKERLAAMGQRLHAMVMAQFAWPATARRLRDHLAGLAESARRSHGDRTALGR